MRRVTLDWCVALGVGLICIAAIAPRAVVGARSLVPGATLAYDPVFAAGVPRDVPRKRYWDRTGLSVHYAAQHVAAEQLRDGSLPLWNPRIGAGAPLLAEGLTAPMSPFLVPYWLSPSETTYSWHLLLRVLIAAAGAFLLARRREVGRGAAAFAALAYASGGLAAVRFDIPTEGAAYALLPFVAVAGERVLAGNRASIPALALVIAAVFYSSHPTLAVLAVGGGLALALVLGLDRDRGKACLRLAAGLGLGLAAAAGMLAPFAEYAAAAWTYKKDPAMSVSLVGSDLDYLIFQADALRVGAATLLLSLAVLIAGGSKYRRPAVAVALTAAGVVALFLLQAFGPAPYSAWIPPRYSLFIFALVLSIVGAIGLHRLCAGELNSRTFWLALAAAATLWLVTDMISEWNLHGPIDVWVGDLAALVACAVALWWVRARPLRAQRAAWLVACVAGAGLCWSFHRAIEPLGDGMPQTEITAALPELPAPPERVVGLGAGVTFSTLSPNTASLYGIFDARASAALFPRRYIDYVTRMRGAVLGPTIVWLTETGSPLLDLLGVRVALVPAYMTERTAWPVEDFAGAVRAARNPAPVPRAFVATEIESVDGRAAAGNRLAELAAAGELPDRVVVEAPAGTLEPLSGGDASVRIAGYAAGAVVLEVDADTDALVVLTDAWAPGWKATVDGKPATIYPADLLFRAVPVRAGDHRVAFSYRPPTVVDGQLVGLIAVELCLGWIVIALLWRRERPGVGGDA